MWCDQKFSGQYSFLSQHSICLSVNAVPFKAVTLQFETVGPATAPLLVTSANIFWSALCTYCLQLLINLKSWKLIPFSVNWSFWKSYRVLHLGSTKAVEQVMPMDAQIVQNYRKHLKILGARWATWGKVHTDDPEILGTIIKYLVACTTWSLRISAPLLMPLLPLTPAKCRVRRRMSWWRNQSPVHHFSGHFHHTPACRHCWTTVNICCFTVCFCGRNLWCTLKISQHALHKETSLSWLLWAWRL